MATLSDRQSQHVRTITLPKQLHDRLVAVAKKNERSVNAEIRVAVRDYLDREAA